MVNTSVVITLPRGTEPTSRRFENLLREERVCLSTISVFELRLGERESQEPSLDNLFEVVRILPFTEQIANRSAEIYRSLEETGDRIGLRDTFIGSTALVEGLPLYTEDLSHFRRIESLEVLEV